MPCCWLPEGGGGAAGTLKWKADGRTGRRAREPCWVGKVGRRDGVHLAGRRADWMTCRASDWWAGRYMIVETGCSGGDAEHDWSALEGLAPLGSGGTQRRRPLPGRDDRMTPPDSVTNGAPPTDAPRRRTCTRAPLAALAAATATAVARLTRRRHPGATTERARRARPARRAVVFLQLASGASRVAAPRDAVVNRYRLENSD